MTNEDHDALFQSLLDGRLPDDDGRFGPFGGRYVPETLMPAIDRLTAGVHRYLPDATFQEELQSELRSWVGSSDGADACTAACPNSWGADVWLKREDLAHTGAHKINNTIGQALLAQALGAQRIVAETGAGQHGVASAAACAQSGSALYVYMGEVDVARQAPNVDRMNRLGAEVVPVTSGDRTLRSAIDEAIRDWVSDPEGNYYLLGSAIGPHPYPYLVRELQAVIGREARAQLLERSGLPDAAFACVGGGSNAIGLFHGFLADRETELFGVEAGGRGVELGQNSATLASGKPGVLHGHTRCCSTMMTARFRKRIRSPPASTIPASVPSTPSADSWRVDYVTATDTKHSRRSTSAAQLEGILPALESAHALAGAEAWAEANPGKRIVIGMSGRG